MKHEYFSSSFIICHPVSGVLCFLLSVNIYSIFFIYLCILFRTTTQHKIHNIICACTVSFPAVNDWWKRCRVVCFLCSLLMQILSVLASRPPCMHTAEFNYQWERRADVFSASAKIADHHILFSPPCKIVFSFFPFIFLNVFLHF